MSRSSRESLIAWSTISVLAAGVLFASADPFSGHLVEASLCLLAAVRLADTRRPDWHWLLALPALCALWGLLQIQAEMTVHARATVESVCRWTGRAAAMYLASSLFRGRRSWVLQRWIPVAGGFLALGGILAWYTAEGRIYWIFPSGYDGEVMGPFVNRDHWAAFVLLLLPLSLWRALGDSERPWLHAGCSAALFSSVVACGSRAGTGLAAAEFAVLAGVSALQGGTFVRTAVVSGGALVFACVAGWGLLWSRLLSADMLSIRRELWSATVEMIRQRPLAGGGLGTWPHRYPAFAPFDPGLFMNHAHNDWLEWAADGGPGFAAVLLVVGYFSFRAIREAPWAAGVPAVFVHALVDFPFHKTILGLLAFTLLGITSLPRKRRLVANVQETGEIPPVLSTKKLTPVPQFRSS